MSSPITSFAAFVSGSKDIEVLQSFAAAKGMATDRIYTGMIADATEYLKTNSSPDVLLVEIPSQAEAPGLLDALAEVCDANTKVITIGTINEYSFYCWLMDIGITQYLLSPLNESSVEHAFERLHAHGAEEKKDKQPSKLIAVMGARGGVGATSVAINLAGVLAESTHHKVALVDLDPQEGSVALALDIEPTRGLRDALEKPDRIDALFLERVMAKVGKYLSVLSAEESLSEMLEVNDQAAEPLLAELSAKYDYVVLDVPRHMTNFVASCLARADCTILVSELSLLCLRDTLRMQDAMREGWKAKPPLVVANRVGFASKQEVPLLDFEKGIGSKITAQIPFAPDIFMPITRDIPAAKYKTHASVKALYHLASLIAPEVKITSVEQKSKIGFSFLKKKE